VNIFKGKREQVQRDSSWKWNTPWNLTKLPNIFPKELWLISLIKACLRGLQHSSPLWKCLYSTIADQSRVSLVLGRYKQSQHILHIYCPSSISTYRLQIYSWNYRGQRVTLRCQD
jgi:hypothetical protein